MPRLSLAAKRMRASRARRKAGRFVLRLECTQQQVDKMVAARWLGECDDNDKEKITEAAQKVFDAAFRPLRVTEGKNGVPYAGLQDEANFGDYLDD